ncbi:MAG: YdeI/OmpD-associated family protein, partial [Ignavibacteriaceae bacterium]
AMKLNDSEIKISAKSKSSKKKELTVPGYFMKAIKKNKKELKTFENFSYSQKKEYVEWVTEAKTEPTRKKRITTAIEWMSEGKIHNWKYLKK